jgi:hypothetical protein
LAGEAYYGTIYGESESGIAASVIDKMRLAKARLSIPFAEKYFDEVNAYAKGLRFGAKRDAIQAFNRQFVRAVMQGGEEPSIPGVAKLVGEYKRISREQVDRMFEAGAIDEKTRQAWHNEYLPRYYRLDKINDDVEGFNRNLFNMIQEDNLRQVEAGGDRLSEQALYDIIRDAYETITYRRGASVGSRHGDARGSITPSMFKERKLKGDDKWVVDYLEDDPSLIVDRMVASTEFSAAEKENLKAIGFNSFEDLIKAVREEPATFAGKISPDLEKAQRLVEEMPATALGIVNSQIRREFERQFQFDALGKGVSQTIGAISDLGTASRLGMLPLSYIGDLSINIANGTLWRRMIDIARGTFSKDKIGGMSKKELELLGFGLEHAGKNYRNAKFANVLDEDFGEITGGFAWFRRKITQPIADRLIGATGNRLWDNIREEAAGAMNLRNIADNIEARQKKEDWPAIKWRLLENNY